jgi:hypothetical protein
MNYPFRLAAWGRMQICRPPIMWIPVGVAPRCGGFTIGHMGETMRQQWLSYS